MGIGDRHLQNMLVSLATGKSIAIDFGYSFGSAFSLPIPEIAVSIFWLFFFQKKSYSF